MPSSLTVIAMLYALCGAFPILIVWRIRLRTSIASFVPSAPHDRLFDVSPEKALLSELRVSETIVPADEHVAAHVASDFGSVVEHVRLRNPHRFVFITPARSVLQVDVACMTMSVASTLRSEEPADIITPLPDGVSIAMPCFLSSSFIVIWLPPAVRSPDMF